MYSILTIYKKKKISIVETLRENFKSNPSVWGVSQNLAVLLWGGYYILYSLFLSFVLLIFLKNLSLNFLVMFLISNIFAFSTNTSGSILLDRKKILTTIIRENKITIWVKYFILNNLSLLILLNVIYFVVIYKIDINNKILWTMLVIIVEFISIFLNYYLVKVMFWRKFIKRNNAFYIISTTLIELINMTFMIMNQFNFMNYFVASTFEIINYVLIFLLIIRILINIFKNKIIKNKDILFLLKYASENIVIRKIGTQKSRKKTIIFNDKIIYNFIKYDILTLRNKNAVNFSARIFFGYIITFVMGYVTLSGIRPSNIAYYGIISSLVYFIITASSSRCIISSEGSLIYLLNNKKIIGKLIIAKNILSLFFLMPIVIFMTYTSIMNNANIFYLFLALIVSITSGNFLMILSDILFPKIKKLKDDNLPSFNAGIIFSFTYFSLNFLFIYFLNKSMITAIIIVIFMSLLYLIQGKVFSKISFFAGEE